MLPAFSILRCQMVTKENTIFFHFLAFSFFQKIQHHLVYLVYKRYIVKQKNLIRNKPACVYLLVSFWHFFTGTTRKEKIPADNKGKGERGMCLWQELIISGPILVKAGPWQEERH